jgi:hypothetical protein
MESYLGGAASVQNSGTKPQGWSLRERSQGGPAMGRHEEACSVDLAGGPLSPNEGRVSCSRTKPSLLVPRSSRPTTNAVCWLGGKVQPALMPGKRFVSLTDEVPRGSSPCSISCVYKAKPKGYSDAPAAGTATPWPRSQGCPQRQSMSSAFDGRKAKPQSDSIASASSWDKLASAKNGLLRLVLHCERSCLGGSCLAPSAELPILGKSSALHRNRTRPRVIGDARCGKSARRPNMRN